LHFNKYGNLSMRACWSFQQYLRRIESIFRLDSREKEPLLAISHSLPSMRLCGPWRWRVPKPTLCGSQLFVASSKHAIATQAFSAGIRFLLAREHHFPKTIADLYDPDAMPDDLRAAHERNDEVLERIYIGRRFKNDTERLEKLFDLYTKMTAEAVPAKAKKRKAGANA
jgi:hypothetical protein